MEKVNNNFLFNFLLRASVLALFLLFPYFVFASTLITDNINTDTLWTLNNSPYIISDTFTVSAGATLTIDPGVVVKFDPYSSPSIYVSGSLVINGTKDNKIYFTSNYDDNLGGETDDDHVCYDDVDVDGNVIGEICEDLAYEPEVGDWRGINFINSNNSSIKNAVFKYARQTFYLRNSNLDLTNVFISNSKNAFYLSEHSILNAKNLTCLSLTESCLTAYNFSSINLSDSLIDGVYTDGIEIYNNTSLNISHTTIKNIYGKNTNAILAFNNSSVVGDYVDIDSVSMEPSDSIFIFNHTILTLNHSNIKNCGHESCVFFFDSGNYVITPSKIDIKNSTFDGSLGSLFFTFGAGNISFNLHNSSLKNFSNYALESYASFTLDAKNVWWGDISGPYKVNLNSSGLVLNAFSPKAKADFIPWCLNEKCQTREPVILVPGIMGTQLFKNYDDFGEVWPNITTLVLSFFDGFLDDLILKPDGTENADKPIILGDIIRKTPSTDTFDGLITELKSGGYEEGIDLFVFPYDWRKDNTETAEKLKDKIDLVLRHSALKKVDLVAHSMGGLVVKKYLADYGKEKVDQVFFVGTPQIGAPKAFKALMYGDDMGIEKWGIPFLSPNRIRVISQNMPAVYELLPSKKYVDTQNNKYITDLFTRFLFGNELSDLDYQKTKDLMLKEGRNKEMFTKAESLHDSVDDLDLTGMDVYNFIGSGLPTLKKIIVKDKRTRRGLLSLFSADYKLEYGDGDQTVPKISADSEEFGAKYYVNSIKHSALPSAVGVKEKILALLKKDTERDFVGISKNKKAYNKAGKVVSSHSTVVMHIYDDQGHHTGPVDTHGVPVSNVSILNGGGNGLHIEYGIPSVEYDVLGDNNFAFLPSGGVYRVVTQAVDTGTYNFYVEDIDSEEQKQSEIVWNEIPVQNLNANFEIKISISTNSASEVISPLVQVDVDGDGIFENKIEPTAILNALQSVDLVAPTTTELTSNNLVSFSALDENSGILHTEYSLDGITWLKYENPIDVHLKANEKDLTIQYFSTDKAGNIEIIKSVTILAPIVTVVEKPIIENTVSIVHSSGGRVFISTPILPVQITENKILPSVIKNNLALNLNYKNSDLIKPVNVKIISPVIEKPTLTQSLPLGTGQVASVINSTPWIPTPYLPVVVISLMGVVFIAIKFVKR